MKPARANDAITALIHSCSRAQFAVAPAADLNDLAFVRLRHLRFLQDLVKRASHVIDAAKRIGVTSIEIQPEDIANGRPRLLLAFVGAIFSAFPGRTGAAGRVDPHAAAAAREVYTYRVWLKALGVDLFDDLFEECKTGLPLLCAARCATLFVLRLCCSY